MLPSAGRPSPTNPYFWRNLAIEMGVLVPLAACVELRGRRVRRGGIVALALILCAVGSMILAASLDRG